MERRLLPWERLALGAVPVASLLLQASLRPDLRVQRLLSLANSEPGQIEAHLRAVRRGWRSRECGHLESQFGINGSTRVGGYELERCLGAGRTAEVWKVRAPGPGPPRHLAMKIWKSAVESPEKACSLLPVVRRRNPEHLQVCRDRGHHSTKSGIRLAFSVGDIVEEVPLYLLRNASDGKLPRLLRSLRGVFDACIQLFDLAQEGMELFAYEGCQLRYIMGDPHPWNVIVDSHDRVRLIDFDDVRCCASCPDGDALAGMPMDCREPCHPRWVPHYRHEVGKVLLQSLLLFLTRWQGEVFSWQSHCHSSEACWALVGGWEMNTPENSPPEQSFRTERVNRVARHLLSRLRASYFQDWSLLPNATAELVGALLAVRDRDGTWPPKVLEFLKASRSALA